MEWLRTQYEWLIQCNKLYPNPKGEEEIYIKKLKKRIRNFCKTKLENGIVRHHSYNRDSESWVDYYLVDTDDIEEFLHIVRIQSPCSDYDCTGRMFTMFLDAAQMPNKNWYVRHVIGIDV